jgi:hypothetical protein
VRHLKLISHFTINQLHYQVHRPFVKVLFLNATLCLEGSRFDSEKKNHYKKERQVIIGFKFQTHDAALPPNSLTLCIWNLLAVRRQRH